MAVTLTSSGIEFPDSSSQTTAGLGHPVSLGSSFEGGYYIGSYYHFGYPYYIVLSPISVQATSKFTTNIGWSTDGRLSTMDGAFNTEYLTNYSNMTAAQYCADLTHNGYSDWYLPSINELLLAVRQKTVLGSQKLFGTKFYQGTSTPFYGWQFYWTSSAVRSQSPTILYSPDGFHNGVNELFGSDAFFTISYPYVRPVRRVAI